MIIGLSPLIMLVVAGLLWSSFSSGMAKSSFRTRAVSIMHNSKGAENRVDGLYKHAWPDGSWVLTSFAEECSGDAFEIYLVMTSTNDIYEVSNIHYCGLEGMGTALGKHQNANEFIGWIKNNHGHLVKND
jgi:hypothetical protein